jgi:hypothetical protein
LRTAIGIVAHVARAEQAHTLMDTVGASYMSLDNGLYGVNGNHKRVWRHMAERFAAHTEFIAVLEDDAVPVDGFNEQLENVLATYAAPVVSLYLGRLRPPHFQHMIEPATKRADVLDANFIVSRQMLHAVGLAIRSDLVADMLDNLNEILPIDEAIGEWVNKRRYRIAYTWPSIIDHADGDTLLQHRDGHKRQPGRVAWRCGTRDVWTDRTVEMS